MQWGFFFDQTRCINCFTCIVACKDWHDVPAGPVSWRRLITLEEGKYPDLFVAFLTTACLHCLKPSCIAACPANAISKREDDGIVVVNNEICTGCRLCLEACPYDAPQFGDDINSKMEKCDMCLDRLKEGKKPICVAGCPMRALDAGPMEELRHKYGDIRGAAGFSYSDENLPSILFKPKKKKFNFICKMHGCPTDKYDIMSQASSER